MLSLPQYRTLSLEAKTTYVFEHGTYLAHRTTTSYSVWLYHVGTFFCEAWVCQTRGELKRLYSFTGSRVLLPYADLVTLPPFFY